MLGLGTFSLDISDHANLDDGNGITITTAQSLTITLRNVNLFAGVGGTFDYDAATGRAIGVNSSAGTGFVVNNAALDIISLKDVSPTPNSWTGVAISADGVALQVCLPRWTESCRR